MPKGLAVEDQNDIPNGLGLSEAFVIVQALFDLAIDLLIVGDFLLVCGVCADSEFTGHC